MRPGSRLAPAFLLAVLAAGCAGQARDYIGPRAPIVTPQLIRYGFSLPQTRCVGERLAQGLTPRQLRMFARAAGAAREPFYDPDRFGVRDLIWVAASMRDARLRAELAGALDGCGVTIESPRPPPAPAAVAAAIAPRPPAWLNLGAAGSGQTIAIDASSLEQEAAIRTAWFRMTNPGAGPSPHNYRLRIDCAHRTIQPIAHRQMDAAGTISDLRAYAPDEERPAAVEGGTVTEIAFLSLCT